jgi:TusA-related sulfurtransferase
MAEVRIDCMYETCPIPLLKALKQLEKMNIGDILI